MCDGVRMLAVSSALLLMISIAHWMSLVVLFAFFVKLDILLPELGLLIR